MVFACEAMDGKTLYVCCCDAPGAMGCEMGGNDCNNHQNVNDCCDTSYERLPSSVGISQETHALQLLSLDAAQPPPVLLPVTLPAPNAHYGDIWHHSHAVFPVCSATYLLTQRLRI